MPARTRRIARFGLLSLALMCRGEPARAFAPVSLDATLAPYLERSGLPALAAAVTRDGAVVAAGAVGTRRVGTQTAVTLDDRFHLGSDTKAMTALVAAMLVEEGRLRWGTTIGEVFPELAGRMDAGLAKVTLTQLLSHTSGVPSDDQAFTDALARAQLQPGNLDELRYGLLRDWCPQRLAATPGSTFAYANMNYVIVGAMLERRTGRTWDELVVERVFAPLGLRTAGLGNQASIGRVDAPLGHALVDGNARAMLSGPNGDNPPLIGPAGIAHMSVLDFARWAAWNTGEGRHPPALVQAETLRRLHAPVIAMAPGGVHQPGTPPGGRYGLGWGEVRVDWAPRPLVYHGGSNGMNVAHIWLDPAQDAAIVALTNVGGARAEEGLRAVAAELYARYLAPDAPPLPTASASPAPSRRAYFSGDTRRGVGH